MLHAALNIGLRIVTNNAVRWARSRDLLGLLVFISVLAGCSTTNQILDTNLFYKRDIGIEVNGKQYEGVVVIPKAPKYNLVLKAKGKLDLVLIRSCHREFSGEKLSSGWLGNNSFKYEYVPTPGIEDTRTCPLRVEVYEAEKGRNSWALLDFESPDYVVPYWLQCNGSVTRPSGVGVCQTKAGLAQRVRFDEPIRFAPPEPVGCALPMKKDGAYEFLATTGECLYHFDTQDGRKGRLIVIGYQGVLVREAQ